MTIKEGKLYFNFAHIPETICDLVGETRFGFYLYESDMPKDSMIFEFRIRTAGRLYSNGTVKDIPSCRIRSDYTDENGIRYRYFAKRGSPGGRPPQPDEDDQFAFKAGAVYYCSLKNREIAEKEGWVPEMMYMLDGVARKCTSASGFIASFAPFLGSWSWGRSQVFMKTYFHATDPDELDEEPKPDEPEEKPEEPKPVPAKKTVKDIVVSLAKAKVTTMLYGPSGTGKTHMAIEIVKAMGFEPYVLPITAETKLYSLIGYTAPGTDGHSHYMPTPFRKAIEEGRPVIVDEADSNAELLLYFNSASNGFLVFPDGNVPITGWLCLTANTNGTGASEGYIRQALDMATKKRVATVYIGYNQDIERTILPAKECQVLWTIRDNIDKHGIRNVLCTTRDFVNTKKMLDAGFSLEECIDVLIVQGMDSDVRSKMLAGVSL